MEENKCDKDVSEKGELTQEEMVTATYRMVGDLVDVVNYFLDRERDEREKIFYGVAREMAEKHGYRLVYSSDYPFPQWKKTDEKEERCGEDVVVKTGLDGKSFSGQEHRAAQSMEGVLKDIAISLRMLAYDKILEVLPARDVALDPDPYMKIILDPVHPLAFYESQKTEK